MKAEQNMYYLYSNIGRIFVAVRIYWKRKKKHWKIVLDKLPHTSSTHPTDDEERRLEWGEGMVKSPCMFFFVCILLPQNRWFSWIASYFFSVILIRTKSFNHIRVRINIWIIFVLIESQTLKRIYYNWCTWKSLKCVEEKKWKIREKESMRASKRPQTKFIINPNNKTNQ